MIERKLTGEERVVATIHVVCKHSIFESDLLGEPVDVFRTTKLGETNVVFVLPDNNQVPANMGQRCVVRGRYTCNCCFNL